MRTRVKPDARNAVTVSTTVVACRCDVYDACPIFDDLRIRRNVKSNFVVGRQVDDRMLNRFLESHRTGRCDEVRSTINDFERDPRTIVPNRWILAAAIIHSRVVISVAGSKISASAKRLKLLHDHGFTDDEKELLKHALRALRRVADQWGKGASEGQ